MVDGEAVKPDCIFGYHRWENIGNKWEKDSTCLPQVRIPQLKSDTDRLAKTYCLRCKLYVRYVEEEKARAKKRVDEIPYEPEMR